VTPGGGGPPPVVVTGAGSGIGEAVALLMAGRGAPVAVLDIDPAAADRTVARARKRSADATVLAVGCDVGSEDETRKAFDRVLAEMGPPQGLFAGAAIDEGGLVHELGVDAWQRTLDTNLTGVFLSCRAMIQQLLQRNLTGSIVCASSPAAVVALPAAASYSASKGGIAAFVRCLAIDYAAHGIRVNAVMPGPTDTPLMWANVPPDARLERERQVSSEVPLGRVGQPHEIAAAVAWLLSDEAAFVTGSALFCDGGVAAKASVSF
jgi:NAD(P)-dependent dehydrogenase (short-subunit alcohol dehydrogenase family)